MTSSMIEKNKIGKPYIYLKINCIILALEWENPPENVIAGSAVRSVVSNVRS